MWSLDQLVQIVDGRLKNSPTLSGADDSPIEIHGAATISNAGRNDITFVTSQKYLEEFESGPAAAAIVCSGLKSSLKPCIEVENPEEAFAKIVLLFRPLFQRSRIGISPDAIVSPSAKISDDVCIYPGAVVMDNAEIGCGTVIYPQVTIMENCRIGSNVKIFPNVVLYENTEIGDRCIIHAGVVIGAYGFGYSTVAGEHQLSQQLGNVKIECDVEIGANSTIDRGTYDATVVGTGTKIDDLVMIGHNCRIGKHNLLCSQVGIAGSCRTGDYVVMGGQVGMADHLDIGDNVAIGAQSGLMHDVEEGQRLFGSPARPAREEMQLLASRAKLPEMRKTIRQLEKQINRLSEQVGTQQEIRLADRGVA
jgi:UDP-3-O-[3-hydroxymyristoyl] glucosamine N-acyltransferase